MWVVRGRTLSDPRLPAIWARCRGRCGVSGIGRSPTPDCPPSGWAAGAGVGRPGSDALPPPTARPLGGLVGGVRGWTLSHPRLPALWAGCRGRCGASGVGRSLTPDCPPSGRAAGAGVGPAGSDALPPPTARPLGGLPGPVWGVRGRTLSHPRLPALWAGCRVAARVRALLCRVGRAGLPGAFWCASPFLRPFLLRSLLVRPPPGWGCPVCGCCWVFFFFSLPPLCAPRCLLLCVFSGLGCIGPWRSVPSPPPPFFFWPSPPPCGACVIPCCAVVCCVVLLRSFGAGACCAVPSGAARRPGALCFAVLCFPVFPLAVCVLSWRGGACRCSPLCFVLCVSWGAVLCVPCPLRSVRCCASLCWCACVVLFVWCVLLLAPGAVVCCCVLWCFLWCAVVRCWVWWPVVVCWCRAVAPCCPFSFAGGVGLCLFPVCAVLCCAAHRVVRCRCGLRCCWCLVLCVVASPWAFCGVVVLLWVSWCLAVLCVVLWCPAPCAVSCGAVLPCGAVLVGCAVRLSALLVVVFPFVLFSFAKNPCCFSVPLKTFLKPKFYMFLFGKSNSTQLTHACKQQYQGDISDLRVATRPRRWWSCLLGVDRFFPRAGRLS